MVVPLEEQATPRGVDSPKIRTFPHLWGWLWRDFWEQGQVTQKPLVLGSNPTLATFYLIPPSIWLHTNNLSKKFIVLNLSKIYYGQLLRLI